MATLISGKYELLNTDPIGRGGMGAVYKVRDSALNNIRAMKVLASQAVGEPEMVKRFRNEAQLMSQLTEKLRKSGRSDIPVVWVYDAGRDDEYFYSHYFVMDYVDGVTLREHLNSYGGLPLEQVLNIGSSVARTLEYIHKQRIIHRDIKPSNIMIETPTAEAPTDEITKQRVVVMDLGIAKFLGGDESTKTGMVMGTPRYSPPEQILASSKNPIDSRADIYALGMVLYEAFTGEPFFDRSLDTPALVGKICYETEENVPDFPAGTLPQFTSLITRSIAKSRENRFPSMGDFLQALEVCEGAVRQPRSRQDDDLTETDPAYSTIALQKKADRSISRKSG